MRILVTGARGMLGRRLLESLAPMGEVQGVDLPELDITDPVATDRWVAGAHPEVVVHAAAMTDVDGCQLDPPAAEATNVAGSTHVARAARRAGARMLAISTDFVFPGDGREPLEEDAPTGPLSVYGRTKLEGERAVRRECPEHLVVRTAWLFGPQGRNFVRTILEAARSRPALRIVDDQLGSPTYSRDLAGMVRELIRCGARGTVHAVNAGRATWFDLARRALDLAGLQTPVAPQSSRELNRQAPRPPFSVLSTRRLTELTGLIPRPWERALEDYIREDLREESEP